MATSIAFPTTPAASGCTRPSSMVEHDEADDALGGKTPAPVTSPAKKAPAKRAPAKRAAAKTTAPPRRLPPRASRQEGSRQERPRPRRRRRPEGPCEEQGAGPTLGPRHRRPGARGLGGPDDPPSTRWPLRHRVVRRAPPGAIAPEGAAALVVSASEELLNDLVLFAIGGGVELEPLETAVAMPGMGETDVRLALTVTGGTMQLSAEDEGLARVVVTATGDVSPEPSRSAPHPRRSRPAVSACRRHRLPSRCASRRWCAPRSNCARTTPCRSGSTCPTPRLVSLAVDDQAPVPEGLDPASWQGILSVFSMVSACWARGCSTRWVNTSAPPDWSFPPRWVTSWSSWALPPVPASVSVGSGTLTVTMAAAADVVGHALPVPIAAPGWASDSRRRWSTDRPSAARQGRR